MSNDKAYEAITARILESLDAGIVPWRKPWSLPAGMRPYSIRGHVYTGINALVLGLSGYSDPRWITFANAIEMGGNVRKGEKSTPAVFLKVMDRKPDPDDADEKPGKYAMLKKYALFNVTQCEGLDIPVIDTGLVQDFDPIAQAEAIIANMPNRPAMGHDGGDRAFYRPATD
ncbi:MAG: ArdC-like ssDNA-binding domain-containing protein, partial [Chloroflexi bacterium]|nr:ArdC-like ssDNA-binding domain-containing protein [Chloroflexota bacterium]